MQIREPLSHPAILVTEVIKECNIYVTMKSIIFISMLRKAMGLSHKSHYFESVAFVMTVELYDDMIVVDRKCCHYFRGNRFLVFLLLETFQNY